MSEAKDSGGAPSEREGRALLMRLAEHLRKQRLPGRAVSPSWAKAAADAVDGYLEGRTASLDAAFGQKRGAGRPANPDRKERIALKAIQLRIDGLSWSKVAEALRRDRIYCDESVIRDCVNEYRPRIVSEKVVIEAHAESVARDLEGAKDKPRRRSRG